MPTFLTKEFSFDASHRLFEYDGKCSNLHGHTYRVIVEVETEIDPVSKMGVDFGLLSIVGTWLDSNWDHACLLNSADVLVGELSRQGHKIQLFEGNPTAENMAEILFGVASHLLKQVSRAARVESVTVYETDTSSATYVPDK